MRPLQDGRQLVAGFASLTSYTLESEPARLPAGLEFKLAGSRSLSASIFPCCLVCVHVCVWGWPKANRLASGKQATTIARSRLEKANPLESRAKSSLESLI